jgi:hypothetical protein
MVMTMIMFNRKDKFLEDIVETAKALKTVKKHKGTIAITAYGVSKDRGIDVAIHPEFRALPANKMRKLLKFFGEKGVSTTFENFWEHSREYDCNVVGLGYTLRKTNPALAGNILNMIWLACNNHIKELVDEEEDYTEAQQNSRPLRDI